MKFFYNIFCDFRHCRKKLGGSWFRILKWDDAWDSYVQFWIQTDERPKEYEIPYEGGGSCGQSILEEEVYGVI